MSSRERIRQSCLIRIRDVQGAAELFQGKLEESLDLFLNDFEPRFFAFAEEKLPNGSLELKYAVGMIICQLLYAPLRKDDPEHIQYSFNARFWKRYECCTSNLELEAADKKLLDHGEDRQQFLTETQIRHPLARRYPERLQYVKQILLSLGVAKIGARDPYFRNLGEWENEIHARATASTEEESVASDQTVLVRGETDDDTQRGGSSYNIASVPAQTGSSRTDQPSTEWVHYTYTNLTYVTLRNRNA